jgi:hypothetical protein
MWVSFNSWCTANGTGAEERLQTVGWLFIDIVGTERCLGVIVWQPKVCSSLFVELKFACLEFIYVE